VRVSWKDAVRAELQRIFDGIAFRRVLEQFRGACSRAGGRGVSTA